MFDKKHIEEHMMDNSSLAGLVDPRHFEEQFVEQESNIRKEINAQIHAINVQKKSIIDAWATIRTTNMTIPDDVLDFMKNSAIEKLDNEMKEVERFVTDWTKATPEFILELWNKVNDIPLAQRKGNKSLLSVAAENGHEFGSKEELVKWMKTLPKNKLVKLHNDIANLSGFLKIKL